LSIIIGNFFSFNPTSNRDSASSDESYEADLENQFKDSSSSDNCHEAQGLTNPQQVSI